MILIFKVSRVNVKFPTLNEISWASASVALDGLMVASRTPQQSVQLACRLVSNRSSQIDQDFSVEILGQKVTVKVSSGLIGRLNVFSFGADIVRRTILIMLNLD